MRRQFLWLFLLALFLNFSDRVFNLTRIKGSVSRLLSPIAAGMVETRLGLQEGLDFIASLPFVYRENLQLREELAGCQQCDLREMELVQENESLRGQLAVDLPTDWKLSLATIIGYAEVKGEKVLLVRGTFNLHAVVVSGESLVGEVVSAGSGVSGVRSILSPQSRVAVNVLNGGGVVEALSEGRFSSEIYLISILVEHKIAIGDLVVTSGSDGKFPRDLILGTVEEISETAGEALKSARVKGAVNLKDLKNVFVIGGAD